MFPKISFLVCNLKDNNEWAESHRIKFLWRLNNIYMLKYILRPSQISALQVPWINLLDHSSSKNKGAIAIKP